MKNVGSKRDSSFYRNRKFYRKRERDSERFPAGKCEEETKTKHASGLKREKKDEERLLEWNRKEMCNDGGDFKQGVEQKKCTIERIEREREEEKGDKMR